MRAAIGTLFLLALSRLGEALPECRGLAPARAACSTAFVTVTVDQPDAKSSSKSRLAPTATVTIDSFGVPLHGPDDDDEKASSSTPLGHCGPAPPEEPTSQSFKACGNANTKTPMETSTSSANKCAQVSGRTEAASTASSGSQAAGPVLATGGSSSPLSSSQSVSPSNITSGHGVLSTGTVPRSGALPSSGVSSTGASASSPGFNLSTSPMPSLTEASYTAGPIYVTGTGASDVGWQGGTSVPGPRNYSRTVSPPSSFTASGVTRGPMGSQPSSWGSTSPMGSPPGLTASGFTRSGETVGPTGSMPSNWNSSQTDSAPPGFTSPGSMTSTVTEVPKVSIPISPSSLLTAGSPSGFITSSDIQGSTSPQSESRVASETVPAPSSVTTSGTPVVPAGQTSRAPLENPPGESPPGESPPEENLPGKSEAANDTPASASVPSPLIPAEDTASSHRAAESSSPPGGDIPSLPYNPPAKPLRKRTIPPFTQQGVVQDLLSRFSFPDIDDLYKRSRQASPEAPIPDLTPTSTGYADTQTSLNSSPTGSPSREYTCACALPTTTAQEASLTPSASSFTTGVCATSQGANTTTFPGTGISVTSSPSGTAKGTSTPDADGSIPAEATGSSLTPSPSANMSNSVGTPSASITSLPGASATPSPSANISTSVTTTGVPLTHPPGASITPASSANISASFTETGASITSSVGGSISIPSSANLSSSFETQGVSASTTSFPGANMTSPVGTTAASATPTPSSNMTMSLGATGCSSLPSPHANVTSSMGTGSSSLATTVSSGVNTPLTDAPYFTNSTSAVLPTPTGASQQSSFGSSAPASSVLTARTSAFTRSANASETRSSTRPMTTSTHPSASLTASSLPSGASRAPGSTSSAICDSVSIVGNETIDFDDKSPGQLFNPYHNLWFSEGFVVSQDSQSPYRSSSGNQLAEFIPASLSDGRFSNISHDLAMISVGPQKSNPCFRFNLYSMSLGCPPNLPEPFCEFSIWGMRYDEATDGEEGTGTDEDVQTMMCDQDRCDLSLTEFNTYKNITSFIVKATAGNETRKWWADNLVMGWTDNSCRAAECRGRAVNVTGSPKYGQRLRL